MGALFSGCSKLAELDLSGIDSSKVTVMDGIFEGCEALDRLTLGEKFAFRGNGKRASQGVLAGGIHAEDL